MSEANDSPDPKLERMLRRWGAEEAAARAAIGRAPRPAPEAAASRKPPARGWAGWLFGLAGALAVAAGVVVGFLVLMGRLSEARNDAQRLSREAGESRGAAEDLQRRLDNTVRHAADDAKELQRRAGQFASDANDREILAGNLKVRLADAERDANARQAELTRVSALLAKADQTMSEQASALKKAEEANQAASVKLEVAIGENKVSLKAIDDAVAAVKKAQTDVEDLKVRQSALWSDFRQAYLAAAAPGETGLKAAQTAVRQSRLIERCGKVRQAVDAAQRPLMERLETVLTKLEMVDAGNFDSEGMFRSLLHSSGVQKQIDDAIESRTLAPVARSVFFEAKFVLGGADRAE